MTRKGMCCAMLGDCAYIFGGVLKSGYGLHELNLERMVCHRLESKNRENGPMKKRYAGMVAWGGNSVFCGYGAELSLCQSGAIYSAHVDWPSLLFDQ